MDRELYWLWLTNIKGFGRKKINVILENFETPEKAFLSSEKCMKEIFEAYTCFRKEDIDFFCRSRDLKKLEQYHQKVLSLDIHFTSIENSTYPKKLKSIYDPPFILYYRGKPLEDGGIKIAIVGSRKCTAYGKKIGEYFGRELAKNNITIVSGMARGIDTAAHIGALEAKGRTIAVFGCGINICYPQENLPLIGGIMEEGSIISEFPINTKPLPGNFPLRNRIISGLCDGILVIEAGDKSGSLITADSALEQGRDVFSVPGRLFDDQSIGTNRLIKMGAKLVQNIDDILEEYIDLSKKKYNIQMNYEKGLEKDEYLVYSCISLEPIHLDTICQKSKINIEDIQLLLFKLELKGIIEQLPNKYYIKKI